MRAFPFTTLFLLGVSFLQGQPMISSISPATIAQGTTDVVVTFTLPSGPPPPPPQGVLPNSVTIGEITGTDVSRPQQTTVLATFDFPADTVPGEYEAAIQFNTPMGTLTYTGTFEVTSADSPPVVITHPESLLVAPEQSATFNCAVSSSSVVSYQWFFFEQIIPGANESTLTIESVVPENAGPYRCEITNSSGFVITDPGLLTVFSDRHLPSYTIVDTNQSKFYGETDVILPPQPGEPFAGQDAQYRGNQPFYTVSDDGLTVYDHNTRLTWTQTADTNGDGTIDSADKFTYTTAQNHIDALNTASYGGFDDWRVPTIKELYSLIDFSGIDASGQMVDPMDVAAFIDRSVFGFEYGDVQMEERLIDAQFLSSTLYVDTVFNGDQAVFGLNLADGRLKGYPLDLDFYLYAVRGNPLYGVNDFVDNGDGTVTDRATGMMWQKTDSLVGMSWEEALAYAEGLEAGGYRDWRLPNAKELHSILDYSRSPATSASAAIDSVFEATAITNENGVTDYPWYWTSTTFLNTSEEPGGDAVYHCFGRGMGYANAWLDVHGAGAQRSDPKAGELTDYDYAFDGYYSGNAPQGDAVRIDQFVRCVRGGATPPMADSDSDGILDWDEFAYTGDTTSLVAEEDWDDDQRTNLQELEAGTLLDDPLSFFAVHGLEYSPSEVMLTWPSALDRIYRVSESTDLVEFTPVSEELSARPPVNLFTIDPEGTTTKFYRIDLVPSQGAAP